jgi:hypothetical protein
MARRGKSREFVGWMLQVIDDLKTGRSEAVKKVRRMSRDGRFVAMMKAIDQAVTEGRSTNAYHTAYAAALYAYQESIDHLRYFHPYLDDYCN